MTESWGEIELFSNTPRVPIQMEEISGSIFRHAHLMYKRDRIFDFIYITVQRQDNTYRVVYHMLKFFIRLVELILKGP